MAGDKGRDLRAALLAFGAEEEDIITLAPVGHVFAGLRDAGEMACVRHAAAVGGWPLGAALRRSGFTAEEYASLLLDGAPC